MICVVDLTQACICGKVVPSKSALRNTKEKEKIKKREINKLSKHSISGLINTSNNWDIFYILDKKGLLCLVFPHNIALQLWSADADEKCLDKIKIT